jgi:hypothetical protein
VWEHSCAASRMTIESRGETILFVQTFADAHIAKCKYAPRSRARGCQVKCHRPPAPSTRAPHSTHRASGSVLSQPQHNTHNNNHRKRCAPEVKLTEGPVSVLCQLLLCRYKRETESQSRRTNEIIRQKCVNLKNQQLLGAARH